MAHDNYPRGAGLGRDANPRQPGLVDYEWTMQYGSRSQRREIVRQLKMYKRQGQPGAERMLADMQAFAAARTSREWMVSLPGQEPFRVVCPKLSTANEICTQFPGAVVEALDGF
ncbi:hypothetical protein [Aromatoleum anaerobium]|uniref:Uncharacterized protein n=1 Tax=Aromatoleum anaerobium TaxID=182180 RepID=A0ABX1PTL8_9RHOO|nr:hypothetical protein [Aromatoleum anaerobium]MCK0508475.1 hypothetical protein [Aromatoleum anaerobium]